MTATKARDLAGEVVSAINARDHSYIDKLTTDQVQLRLPPDQVFFGRDGVRDFVNVLEDRLPKATLIARKVHAGEDFAVVEYDINSTTKTGREVEGMGAVVPEPRRRNCFPIGAPSRGQISRPA
ncbi:MAG: nuclear transport factor 2 family protein [Chloroflexi bacterium]|nr:MAG: nuclear transport factor 2 family protein [Chloroflexota bacterium]